MSNYPKCTFKSGVKQLAFPSDSWLVFWSVSPPVETRLPKALLDSWV